MRTLKPGSLLLLALIATSSLACKEGGCGGGGGGTATPASSAADSSTGSAATASASVSASALARAPRMPAIAAGGATGALFRAVNTIELKGEQKATVEKIGADFREADRAARADTDGGGPRSEMKEAHAELVTEVKAGKIDPSKMTPHYAALEKAAKARQDREADALNRLHAALDPAQRTAVAASVRSFETQRAARMKGHEKPDAGRTNHFRVERYTRELDLDAEQQKKVEAILPKEDRTATLREDMKKHTDAVVAAFEKDGFDAKKLDSGAAKQARAPMEDQVKFFAQLVPILKPEQRERLAKNLAKGSEGHGRMHRGMGMGDRAHELPDEDED
jgi:Spy/CpxP family protein refolding chaperone